MFQLSNAPEMTTAITDGLFGLLAFYLALRLDATQSIRTKLWKFVLGGIGLSAVLGVPAHAFYRIAGLNPPDLRAQTLYWVFLGFFLFLMASLLAVAVLNDICGESKLARNVRIMAGLGSFFYILYLVIAVFQLIAGYFIVFIAYSALVMMASLVAYLVLAVKRRNRNYLIFVAAIVVAIIANLVQASGAFGFTVIWKFDSNSVYHFIMMVSVLLFYRGVRKES